VQEKRVILLRVKEYSLSLLKQEIKKALDNFFSLDKMIKGNKVLLKPNLLTSVNPNYAITTHPVFVEAVGCVFKEKGLDVYIADNPSVFNTETSVEKVYRETQIEDLAYRNNFKLLYPSSTYILEGIPFSKWSRDFTIINLPKFKTHNITIITCAVKNLYGCISGAYKNILHKLYPKTKDFIGLLLELYKLIKPTLSIVDGIVSLEGEGPATGGVPRHTEFVAIGDDALCVDYAVSRIIGLSKDKNPLIRLAEAKGYFNSNSVKIVSESDFTVKDFKLPSQFFVNNLPIFVIKMLSPFIKIYPKVNRDLCRGCNDCIKSCPLSAIVIKKQKAWIDYSKCIRCMCCFEVCRFKAIGIEKSFLLKIKDFL